MSKFHISMVIGLILSVCLATFGGFGAECAEIRENVVRLHVLANSDSDADQALKYKVRDALLAHSPELFGQSTSKEEAERELAAHLPELERIARETLAANGCAYPVEAKLVNMYFETRQYEDFTVPAGRYDAIRIVIGEGKGQNWWCVMFPPMCVPAATDKDSMAENPVEQQLCELGSQPVYKPRFAIVELLESAREALVGEGDTELELPAIVAE
ncbi:stage II sporulation protein R [Ruminococcaceae bacterium OttesenSCG-928-L11]|nr:stage II sporulation protein R [Ruminococcaceae bacterium OttesenSCG-928-L11]